MSKVIGIEYSLKDANSGEQLDSNVGGAPLEFISGRGQIIPGLESKLVEMAENEQADVMVQPAESNLQELN
jgi:FKBP-type peptidyl-prolyl cis-trans isomerase SlyD